jgi:hypothetical protein
VPGQNILVKAPSSDDEQDLCLEAGDGDDDTASIDDDYELDDIHARFLASKQPEEEVNPMLDHIAAIPYVHVERDISDCIIA